MSMIVHFPFGLGIIPMIALALLTVIVLFHRERVCQPKEETLEQSNESGKRTSTSVARASLHSPPALPSIGNLESAFKNGCSVQDGLTGPRYSSHILSRSSSMGAYTCSSMKGKSCEVNGLYTYIEDNMVKRAQSYRGPHGRVCRIPKV